MQLQRGPVSQSDVLQQVSAIMTLRIDEDEEQAGTEILRRMNQLDCTDHEHRLF